MHTITMINIFKKLVLVINLVIFIFTFNSCSIQSPENIVNMDSLYNVNSNKITDKDIEFCIKETLNNYPPEDYQGIQPIISSQLYDIDNDSQQEVLILSGVIRNELFIYKKQSDEKIIKIGKCGYGKLDYVNDFRLYTYKKDNTSYPFFIFHYDNGGVMNCDVIASIEYLDGNYDIQYKLSWGKNKYKLDNEIKEVEFYRLGWDKTNVAIDGSDLDITKEEFDSIYSDYKLAMQN